MLGLCYNNDCSFGLQPYHIQYDLLPNRACSVVCIELDRLIQEVPLNIHRISFLRPKLSRFSPVRVADCPGRL